jgi:hypothetical protein
VKCDSGAVECTLEIVCLPLSKLPFSHITLLFTKAPFDPVAR